MSWRSAVWRRGSGQTPSPSSRPSPQGLYIQRRIDMGVECKFPAPATIQNMSLPQYTLTEYQDDFGSRYLAGRLSPDSVLDLAGLELEKMFRRVILDPAHGLVMLMTPSRAHEDAGIGVDAVIDESAELLGLKNEALRSLRWRPPGSDPNTGAEADCSYYIGANAIAYIQARTEGHADKFVEDRPPNLVVEIGVTHVDRKKQEFYRDLGVSEYWQARVSRRTNKIKLTFLDLLSATPMHPLPASRIFLGLTPPAVAAAVYARFAAAPDRASRSVAITATLRKSGFPRPVAVASAQGEQEPRP